LIVAVLSTALTMQGWRSRIPAFDMLPYLVNIQDFLGSGLLPRFGDTSSYGSLSPPGTTWLMLPGALLFQDIRLTEYTGAALLHFATLLGIFLLGREAFGYRTGLLAVLLYGLSANALFFAGSLWPIARPDIYVWVVYLSVRWAVRDDPRYLGAAAACSLVHPHPGSRAWET
jgi:hypothetical protein